MIRESILKTTKEAAARAESNSIFMTLMKEHREVSAAMAHITKTVSAKIRAQLYPAIRGELLAHEHGELSQVYPILARHPETRQIALDHEDEAGELTTAIRALDRLAFDAPNWGPAFARLTELVARHVEEEEGDYFPTAQTVIGADEAVAIERLYRSAKESALETK